MRSPATNCVFCVLIANFAIASEKADFFPQLQTYLEIRVDEFDQIKDERKVELRKIALYVQNRAKENQPVRLTFICTHNSRRSHMSQIWAATAASFYGIEGIETFSGGAEATAFNPRATAALKRSGLKVVKSEDGKNPHYEVRFQGAGNEMVCYSKVFNEAPNPKDGFCAVMVCSQADKSCPVVDGCSLRIAIPFDDPKIADDKPEEETTYDERTRQICREMLFLFSQVNN